MKIVYAYICVPWAMNDNNFEFTKLASSKMIAKVEKLASFFKLFD